MHRFTPCICPPCLGDAPCFLETAERTETARASVRESGHAREPGTPKKGSRGATAVLALALWAFGMGHASGQYEVSSWRDHFPYGEAEEVVLAGDNVVARTAYALFAVDTATAQVQRWVKGAQLSQGNPSAMAWDATRQQLVIGYADGGIDLRSEAGLVNIPDLRIAQVVGSKRIASVEVVGDLALLCCSFGVVVLDLERQEVADTWSLASSGEAVDAQCVLAHDGQWLVGTAQGVLAADQTDPFLANPDRWNAWDGMPDLGPVLDLVTFGSTWWAVTGTPGGDDNLVWRQLEGGAWEPMPGWDPQGAAKGGITTGAWIRTDNGTREEGLIVATCCEMWGWDAQGASVPLERPFPEWARANDMAASVDGTGKIWVASKVGGVVNWTPQPVATSVPDRPNRPDGPPNGSLRRLDCWNDNLWVATGGVDASWTPLYRPDGLFGFSDGEWTVPGLPESANGIDGIRDIMDVSIDPKDPTHVVFSSYEEGLIEVREDEVVRVLNAGNSSIPLSLVGGSERSAVSGVDFDSQGNLWFACPWVREALHVMTPDGTTTALDLGDIGLSLLPGDLEVTRDGYVWMALPKGGGVLVYDPAGTPTNPTDDDWTVLSTGKGGLPSNDVLCIEEDLDNEIWVGTAEGPVVFYQSASVFNEDVNASQILISQDGNLQYLLETEVVQSLIIDAGNRKWVGTQGSGVYVLAADGLTTDHHFTVDNSPLPSNDILDIAMDYGSGEVYIGTAQGLLSYRGEATNWDREMADFRVMPNPITADHTGPIVFDGLAYNSTVHVTNAAGQRIAVLKSNGGRATWDGIMENGVPAPYGVYVAFATDSQGKEGAIAKFAVIR